MLVQAAPALAEPLRVIFPQSESRKDGRAIFPVATLRLALEHSGVEFDMQPSAAKMQQSRAMNLLADGRQLDVLWTVATPEREARLRPIRIPIDRGLIGWRVLLIHKGNEAAFAAVDSVTALASLLGVQGHDWPDVSILRSNGLLLATSSTYEGLFEMLSRNHVDYFPRSIGEVDRELERRTQMPIGIEPTLALHYPSALYFWVNPNNDALAAALQTGLERAVADGSLARAVDERFGERIRALDLPHRRILELHNPDLPPTAPIDRPELWIDPVHAP